jgi:hypothetical protein
MLKKPLIATNPYLQTPEKYREALVTNVSSSTAIETGAAVESVARKLDNGDKTKPVKTRQRSAR